jgi:Domain of unknown function (DUF4202)
MEMKEERFKAAIIAFDTYNERDPHKEDHEGKSLPKEVVYAQRMTARLNDYAPDAPESVQLAARCQHIGRWEIAREQYPMDKKGYLRWRNVLKSLHATIAGQILTNCGYDEATIDRVKFLLMKKELQHNPDTQLLEDVICLVFIEHYLEEFAAKHTKEKVIDILRKTMKKMSQKAIATAGRLSLSEKITSLIHEATNRG